jgi:hypothetical protein
MTALWLARLVLPPLVVGLREHGRRGGPRVGDRGDQRDQLAGPVAVAVGYLVFDHPDMPGLVWVQVLAAAGRLDQWAPRGVLVLLRVDQH